MAICADDSQLEAGKFPTDGLETTGTVKNQTDAMFCVVGRKLGPKNKTELQILQHSEVKILTSFRSVQK